MEIRRTPEQLDSAQGRLEGLIKSDKLRNSRAKRDEKTGEILRTPMMPGKLARELPIYFAEVYRSFVKDGVYCAQTKSDSKYQCRTQLGLKPEISLDYKELLNA